MARVPTGSQDDGAGISKDWQLSAGQESGSIVLWATYFCPEDVKFLVLYICGWVFYLLEGALPDCLSWFCLWSALMLIFGQLIRFGPRPDPYPYICVSVPVKS